MRTHKIHKLWLKITALFVASFGLICFLASIPTYSEPARLTLDFLSWPLDDAQIYDSTTRFISAILGGFLFGFGVMIWCLSVWVYDQAPEAVRKSVVVGLCAWFTLDSLGSILSGNQSNALFNIIILLLFIGPLWRPAKINN